MKQAAILAALALLATPGAAQAAPWGGVFSAVTLASDYRYQGVSESRGRPVVQGYVHWQNAGGAFAGLFATQVDYGYAGAPTYELDAYAGKNFAFDAGRSELKLQALSSSFPDNRTPGPTFDFLQTSAQLKRTAGPWTLTGLASYVPAGSYGSGPVVRAEAGADLAVTPALTLRAQLGKQGAGRGHDRAYWSLGAVARWKTLAFELRYVDTDRSRANCGFQPKACDAAVVGTLTVSLPPIL